MNRKYNGKKILIRKENDKAIFVIALYVMPFILNTYCLIEDEVITTQLYLFYFY